VEEPYDCGYPVPLAAVEVGGSSKPPSSLEMDCVLWREDAEDKVAGELRAGRTGDEVIFV